MNDGHPLGSVKAAVLLEPQGPGPKKKLFIWKNSRPSTSSMRGLLSSAPQQDGAASAWPRATSGAHEATPAHQQQDVHSQRRAQHAQPGGAHGGSRAKEPRPAQPTTGCPPARGQILKEDCEPISPRPTGTSRVSHRHHCRRVCQTHSANVDRQSTGVSNLTQKHSRLPDHRLHISHKAKVSLCKRKSQFIEGHFYLRYLGMVLTKST